MRARAARPEGPRVHRAAADGAGFSKQAWGLRAKLLEVDAWVKSGPAVRVAEVHPEVSFAAMHGAPLVVGKRSWGGMNQRRALLAEHGIELRFQYQKLSVSPHS